jgi:putative spermidine/putrescine transport system substrate-binding protein
MSSDPALWHHIVQLKTRDGDLGGGDVMKRYLALALALALGLSIVPATRGVAAKKYDGQTMSVYVGISPMAREDIMQYIAPKLKDEYGLSLSAELLGSTTMIQKLIVMRSKPTVTLINWDEPIGIEGCGMGLCAPIDLRRVPNLINLYPWAIDKVNNSPEVLSTGVVGVGLIYNTEAMKGMKPPTSWNDLWRPELSGRVSITAPESTWGLAMLVMLAKLGGGGANNIDPGFQRLKTLLPHVQTIHTWSSELAKLLQLGQVWLATTGSNMAPALDAQGFPAAWVAPVDGAPMVNGGISIVAHAPYQDAAYTFLNLYFSPEFQALRARHAGLGPTNIRAWSLLSATDRKALPIGPNDLYKLQRLDWVAINEHRAAWVERWHREIQK